MTKAMRPLPACEGGPDFSVHSRSKDRRGSLVSVERGLLAVALAAFLASCAANPKGTQTLTEGQVERSESAQKQKVHPEWPFMSREQREAALYMLSIPGDEVEGVLRKSKLWRIPNFGVMVESTRRMQSALRSNDPKAIRDSAEAFYATMMNLEEALAEEANQPLIEDPDVGVEIMMIQDYYSPTQAHIKVLRGVKG